ncbi:MAG: class I SAM-dependent methyltransferase [Planctomycetota bacterium]
MDRVACQQFLELERTHWWFEGRRRIFFHLLREAIGARRGLRLLDVGCGVGGMMTELRSFGEPLGIDLDLTMVRMCRERGFSGAFLGSGEALPVADGSLDLVTFFDCIEHIDDDEATLRGALRVLKPGGLLFLSVPAFQFLYANNDRVAHHKRRYRLRPLREKLRRAGFEIQRSSYVNALLFPLILPTVLFIKLSEKLRNPRETTNLTYRMPRIAHKLLSTIFSAERHLVSRWTLPLGHSICVLAARPRTESAEQ